MELLGAPWSSMELHGAPWSSLELHGAPWGPLEGPLGVPWSLTQIERTLNDNGTKMERKWNEHLGSNEHGTKMERKWNGNGTKMEPKELHGAPGSSMELHGAPWSSMELHGAPWRSTERPKKGFCSVTPRFFLGHQSYINLYQPWLC